MRAFRLLLSTTPKRNISLSTRRSANRYLKTDHYVTNNYAKECVEAIAAVGEMLEAQHIVIATKAYYTKEIATLEKAIQELGAPVTIFKMKNFYPAGDEQIMVYEVTGRTVPPGGIPIEVGCVISNIATMLNIYQARQEKTSP